MLKVNDQDWLGHVGIHICQLYRHFLYEGGLECSDWRTIQIV